MMKHFFVILIGCLWLAIPLFAQSNKLIRELESKRGALQKQISETESILKDTKKDVGSQFTFYRFHVIIDSNDITFPLLDLAGQYRQTIQLTTHIFLCILQD